MTHAFPTLRTYELEETLAVVRQAPLGHDRTAARDTACDAFRGQRHVAHQHAGVDGEVVHALLGLLDPSVSEDLPRSDELTSELPSLLRTSYALFCLYKNLHYTKHTHPVATH